MGELHYRWQKGTRYYEILLHRDLWGGWTVTRVWGRCGSPLSRVQHRPCESYADGLHWVRHAERHRIQRGYAPVGTALSAYTPSDKKANPQNPKLGVTT